MKWNEGENVINSAGEEEETDWITITSFTISGIGTSTISLEESLSIDGDIIDPAITEWNSFNNSWQ